MRDCCEKMETGPVGAVSAGPSTSTIERRQGVSASVFLGKWEAVCTATISLRQLKVGKEKPGRG